MTVIKTKTKKGYGTVNLEYITVRTTRGVEHSGYVVTTEEGKLKTMSAMRSTKKDGLAFFKRECIRVFGTKEITKSQTAHGRNMPRLI